MNRSSLPPGIAGQALRPFFTRLSLPQVLACLLAACLSAPANTQAQAAAFDQSPFWRASLGWWRSSNTYFDGDLNYRIREYHSLVHVAMEGEELVETEIKFYPPGNMASAYGDGMIAADEGIEVVTSTRWRAESDSLARMTVSAPAFGQQMPMETRIVADDTALRRVTTIDGSERYRMLITLHGADRRNIAHYGLAPDNTLVGFAVFRGHKITEAEVDRARQSLRKRHNVAATVTANESLEPVAARLVPPARE